MSTVENLVDEDHPRKKVRKGTHSCWECRRREVRCVFRRETDSTCTGCIARALKCQSQKYVDEEQIEISTPKTIPDRVGKLEALMENILQRLDQGQPGMIGGPYGDFSPASNGCIVPQSTPVLSLFNNAVLDSGAGNGELSDSYQNRTFRRALNSKIIPLSKKEKTCRVSLALIPPQRQLDAILAATTEWWSSWQKQYPGIYSDASSSAEFISQATAECGPAGIAHALLCIALGIKQLPSDFDFSAIDPSYSPKDLVEKYTSNVTSLVTSEDELVASIDGLECLTLAAKIHLNDGKPHRAG